MVPVGPNSGLSMVLPAEVTAQPVSTMASGTGRAPCTTPSGSRCRGLECNRRFCCVAGQSLGTERNGWRQAPTLSPSHPHLSKLFVASSLYSESCTLLQKFSSALLKIELKLKIS